MFDSAVEVNFDSLVGPTHNYAGLSFGNLASHRHINQPSNPKQAALQGLAKMKVLADLGVPQAVLPPHRRPAIQTLRHLGFSGTDKDVLTRAGNADARLLAACGSASAMWAANAATVSPSADTADDRVHFTPANLASQFHRSLESPMTARILQAIFPDESAFAHHPPLPTSDHFGDEGAANHIRLTSEYGKHGVEVFCYGKTFTGKDTPPAKYPARQSRHTGEAIIRLHGLRPRDTLFARQNPVAIDAGAFHTDVVAVGNINVLFFHAAAFGDSHELIREIRQWFGTREFHLIEVPEQDVPLRDAIDSYMFNSQLVQTPGGSALVAPLESRDCPTSRDYFNKLTSSGPIKAVHYLDVRQSMHNGGGPACLRLRVVLTQNEVSKMAQGVLFTDKLHDLLKGWIENNYRDHLTPHDLADPKLLEESDAALDKLTRILNIGDIYDF